MSATPAITSLILRATALSISFLIILPMVIKCANLLRGHWDELHLKKRRRRIILWIFIFLSIETLIEYPYLILWNPDQEREVIGIDAVNDILWAIWLLPRWSWLSLIVLRIYLLYYDHSYEQFLSTQKWKILMDPNISDTNWFSRNKSTYGNDKWMLRKLWFIIGIYSCVYLIAHSSLLYLTTCQKLRQAVITILSLISTDIFAFIAIVISTIYWRKFPKFMDTLYIRKEIKFIIIIVIFMAANLFPLNFCLTAFGVDTINGKLITTNIMLILCIFLYYVLIIYPIRKFPDNDNNDKPQSRVTLEPVSSNSHRSLRRMTTAAPEQETPRFNRERSWKYIVNTMEGYESFANFLMMEFSTENIIFVTEYVMLKNILNKDIKYTTILSIDLGLEFSLILPDSLEYSMIVKEYEENGLFLTAANALYQKYIDSNAALEVNISAKTRNYLEEKFKDIEGHETPSKNNEQLIIEIMPLFEKAALEVSYLMNDSYSRFKRRNVFHELMTATSNADEDCSCSCICFI